MTLVIRLSTLSITGLNAQRLQRGDWSTGSALRRSKYFHWRTRYGKANEHNGWIPCEHWLEDWEKQAIIKYAMEHPLDGYRRLTFMMLDLDVVAASPTSVYRVMKAAGLIGSRQFTPSNKGKGFVQPLALRISGQCEQGFQSQREQGF